MLLIGTTNYRWRWGGSTDLETDNNLWHQLHGYGMWEDYPDNWLELMREGKLNEPSE